MSAGKKTNKRKASSADSSSEEKNAKRTKTAFEQARRIMKSELETMGLKEVEDYGNMEWNTFKTEHAEVSTTNNKVQVIVASLTATTTVGFVHVATRLHVACSNLSKSTLVQASSLLLRFVECSQTIN